MNRLPDLVRASAERHPEAPALSAIHGGPDWSYDRLRNLMERGGAALTTYDTAPGEPVILYSEPRPEWPLAFFSILTAGCVAVPLPVETPVSAVVTAASLTGARIALVGRRRDDLAGTGLRCLGLERLGVEDPRDPPPAGPPTDLAVLAFTSGSTSRPRIVELTHANLLANLTELLEVRRAGPGDSFLSTLPPAHLFEMTAGLLAPLSCGARIVYTTSLLPNRILEAMREGRITHALTVPALLRVLYDEVLDSLVRSGIVGPDQRRQSLSEAARSLKEMSGPDREKVRAGVRAKMGRDFNTLVIGGAALDPDWADVAQAAGLRLEVGYGLTEASPVVSMALASESPPGSAGRPLPGVEVRIADEDEILVRGPNVMRGYFRDPDGTAAAIQGGWLHTGDRGRLDEAGFLYVTGRLKETLVTETGETLCPEEIEPYYASTLFGELCVTGVPDARGNDMPTLFVVPATPETPAEELRRVFEDLRAAAPPRLRVPQMVRLDGPLPRTALGKIRRRFLAEGWRRGKGTS